MPQNKNQTERRSILRDVRVTSRITARPEAVYEALTSSKRLCAWWTQQAETDARNLGRFRLVWSKSKGRARDGHGGSAQPFFNEGRGVFVDLEPGRKVSWAWESTSPPLKVPPLTNVFIEPSGGGAQVTIIHPGFPSRQTADKTVAGIRDFWTRCLSRLSDYLSA